MMIEIVMIGAYASHVNLRRGTNGYALALE